MTNRWDKMSDDMNPPLLRRRHLDWHQFQVRRERPSRSSVSLVVTQFEECIPCAAKSPLQFYSRPSHEFLRRKYIPDDWSLVHRSLHPSSRTPKWNIYHEGKSSHYLRRACVIQFIAVKIHFQSNLFPRQKDSTALIDRVDTYLSWMNRCVRRIDRYLSRRIHRCHWHGSLGCPSDVSRLLFDDLQYRRSFHLLFCF